LLISSGSGVVAVDGTLLVPSKITATRVAGVAGDELKLGVGSSYPMSITSTDVLIIGTGASLMTVLPLHFIHQLFYYERA
jgi:hypothetical protein